MKISLRDKKSAETALKKLNSLLGQSKEASAHLNSLKNLLSELPVQEASVAKEEEFPIPDAWKDKYDAYCFSDGACRGNPGPGAWGSLIQVGTGEVIFEGSDFENPTTNNRMEMTGALRCLLELRQSNESGAKIIVVSDSKYLVDGMNSWVAGWKKRGWKKADKKTPENVDLWQDLDEARSYFSQVDFFWVKGHAGHPQNERCDQLANEALDNAGH